MHSRQQLTVDLLALGIAPGDTIMVHASVRAIGELAGGPDDVHLALKDAVTPEGTLMMYAGCPRYVDEVGRGNLTPEEDADVLEKLLPFDPDTARSARDHGILVEFLRTYPVSRVNDHVARFVAWGKQTDYLFSSQPWDYAYGRDSALERLVALEGKILLLGSDHDAVTFLHYAEHIADIPDKRVVRYRVPVSGNGARVWRDTKEFDTSAGVHANWPNRFFAKIVGGYLRASANGGGQVGDARCYLFSARGLLDFALPLMERIAADGDAASDLHELHLTEDGDRAEEDLAALSRDALIAEVHRLRQGIRAHRDATGHELCWHHPALWGIVARAHGSTANRAGVAAVPPRLRPLPRVARHSASRCASVA